jgi:hypothetical protein
MNAGDDQVRTINDMNQRFGESVYYMFYNPSTIPTKVRYPVKSKRALTSAKLGCRVFFSTEIHAVLDTLKKGKSPTLKSVTDGGSASNWRLEEWVADYLLACKAGQRFDDKTQTKVASLLERRTGPIGAAIAVSVVLPDA